MIFFNSATDVIFFHFREIIGMIAAVISVTLVLLIAGIVFLYRSKFITPKGYIINTYCMGK